jgi:hypothetical protein
MAPRAERGPSCHHEAVRRAVSLLAMLGLAACGGGGGDAKPKPSPTPASVIRGWAEALRAGDVAKAGTYFALPAVVSNGTPPLTVRTRAELGAFDRALPCGARLLRTVGHHGYVIAEFRLVDRHGPGAISPCPGKGAKAATAFRVVKGKIREWRRVTAFPGDGAPPPTNQT